MAGDVETRNFALMNSLSQSKENTLPSLVALYPEAFVLAMSFYSRSGLALPRSETAGMNRPTVSDHAASPEARSSSKLICPN